MINPTRRKLIGGIGLLFAAPAIVKASSLMPVKVPKNYGLLIPRIVGATVEINPVWFSRVMVWDKSPVIEFTQSTDPYNWETARGSLYNFQGIPIVFDE